MKIIIIGCGKVGLTLAQQLYLEKHELTLIDTDAERIARITDGIDAMGITGNGVDHRVLQEAGVSQADLVIAVTGSDEQNILCCVLASRAGTSKCQTIARIRNPIYNDEADFLKKTFGINMVINPEYAAAVEISRVFQFPQAIRVDSFARGNVELVHFKVGRGLALIGKKLSQLGHEFKTNVLVVMITRDDRVIIPKGYVEFCEGDTVAIAARRTDAVDFFNKIGMAKDQVRNAILAGGGMTSYYLAKQLLATGCDVTIIDSNKERCTELSNLLPKATIILGDAADQELLTEEGFEDCDGFAALTGVDEENILLSLYAAENSSAKTATRVARSSFNSVIDTMNLGSIIYPRVITADYILRFVRSFNMDEDSEVQTLYKIGKGVEALEFVIKHDSKIAGVPISQLKLKQNTLIGSIYRNGQVIVPTGSDCIMAGDSVMFVISGYTASSIREVFE